MASKRLVPQKLECPICLDQYDTQDHLPKGLCCMHTMCKTCTESLPKSGNAVQCPTCKRPTTISDIATNFALMDILETLCEVCLNEERVILCHHCDQNLCAVCSAKHVEEYYTVVKGKLEELNTVIVSANKSSMDSGVLLRERKTAEDVIDEMRKSIQYYRSLVDNLEKELEEKVKQLKESNINRYCEWQKHLTEQIMEAKTFVNKSDNNLDTWKRESAPTKEMSDLYQETCGKLLDLQSSIDNVPWLTKYHFKVSQDKANVGKISVSNVEKYKRTLIKKTVGSHGSGNDEFNKPISVACTDNFIVVADTYNHRIKVFDHNLKLQHMFGQKGSGHNDFDHPWSVCIGANNELFISDPSNSRIKVYSLDGQVIRVFGDEGSGAGQFTCPMGIAVTSGEVFTCDIDNYRVQVTDMEGHFIHNIGCKGSGPGQFKDIPRYVTITKDNRVIVSEQNNPKLSVFTVDGQFLEYFPCDGEQSVALLSPNGLAVDAEDNIIISDYSKKQLVILDKNGDFACAIKSDGKEQGNFEQTHGVCVCQNGDLVVCDSYNHRIHVLSVPSVPGI